MRFTKTGLSDRDLNQIMDTTERIHTRISYLNEGYFVDKITAAAKELFLGEEALVDFGDRRHNFREETSEIELEIFGKMCKFQITIAGNKAKVLRIA